MGRHHFHPVDERYTPEDIAYLDRAAALKEIRAIKLRSYAALGPLRGVRLLEVGCGTGDDAARLARAVGPEGNVVALDSNAAMLAEARARFGQVANLRFELGAAAALPFTAGAFDAVRADRVVHLVADPGAALAEMVRVLRPGGRLAISEPDWRSLVVEGGDADTTRAILDGLASGPRPSTADFVALVQAAGLTIDAVLPDTLVITDVESAYELFRLGYLALAQVQRLGIDAAAAKRWLASLETAAAEGRFRSALTGVTISATRDGGR